MCYAEKTRATNHLDGLNAINHTIDYLEIAAGGGNYEVQEMYLVYKAVADFSMRRRQ